MQTGLHKAMPAPEQDCAGCLTHGRLHAYCPGLPLLCPSKLSALSQWLVHGTSHTAPVWQTCVPEGTKP